MRSKIKFALAIVTILCMLALPTVFGADIPEVLENSVIETEEGYQDIMPLEQGIETTSEDTTTAPEGTLPITDDMLRGITEESTLPITDDMLRNAGNDMGTEEADSNMLLYVACGVAVLVVAVALFFVFKKK